MSAVDAPAPAPRRRWRTVLLVLSLALNLAFVGLFVGLALRGPAGGGGFGVPVDGFRSVVRAMDDEHRGRVWRQIRERGPALRETRREMRSLRTDFLALLRSEDFSAEALEALFQRQSAVLQGLGQDAQAILIGEVTAMTPEERRAMADRLEQELRHSRRGRRGDR